VLTYDQLCKRADDVRRDSGRAVRPGPGKFESNEDRVLAENLWEATLDGWCEEETGDVQVFAWFGRVGRFVCEETGDGFFDVTDHGDEQTAREAFARVADEYAALLDYDGLGA
jgi:hypothetical protein